MIIQSVYVTDPNTGKESHFSTLTDAAKVLGVTEAYLRSACRTGKSCRGFLCSFGEAVYVQSKQRDAMPNICFDCQNACGKCSWTAVDPDTGKLKFEPVPGWTAEKVTLNSGWANGKPYCTETYHITECPLFEADEPRKADCLEMTFAQNRDFLTNVKYLLKRWNHG